MSTANENVNPCMNWDDAIENDDQFILLPENDYIFTVTGFERSWYNGGAKIPACNMAVLTLFVTGPEGSVQLTSKLILHRSLEWKISSFFRSIGMKQHGERLVMDWNHITGKKGLAHIKPRKYTTRDGNESTINDIDKFLDYDANKMHNKIADIADQEEIPF